MECFDPQDARSTVKKHTLGMIKIVTLGSFLLYRCTLHFSNGTNQLENYVTVHGAQKFLTSRPRPSTHSNESAHFVRISSEKRSVLSYCFVRAPRPFCLHISAV